MDNETWIVVFQAASLAVLIHILRELRKLNKGLESDRSGEGDRTIRYPLK